MVLCAPVGGSLGQSGHNKQHQQQQQEQGHGIVSSVELPSIC